MNCLFVCAIRACVTLAIKDGTGSLNVIAMGDEAEKLIGINSHRLYQADKEVLLFPCCAYASKV